MNDLPNESFTKFSPQARAILVAAQRYAETLNAGLGSEHILLALTITPDSPAYTVLRKLPVTLDQLRLVLTMDKSTTPPKGGMATEAKSVLERAAFQAATLQSALIGPEHLLWALTTDAQCRAHQLFHQLGIDPKTVRKMLERQLFEHSQENSLAGHEIEILGVIGQSMTPQERDEVTTPEDHDDEPESATPILDELTTDLTALARENALEPLIGRATELERLTHILGRKTKNNPILIGEPGTGKTAIIEGLAAAVTSGKVPAYLLNTRIVQLELSTLVAGTMYRGQFEERLRRMVAELEEAEDIVLFIDEIHTIVGAGSAEGGLDAANILKPVLAKGQLRVIGATTTAEFKKHIERDAALERRFQPIVVQEPSAVETETILRGLKHRYEQFHEVEIPDTIITEAVMLAGRYLHDRCFPDKAIDLIDEAAASVRAKRAPATLASTTQSLQSVERELKGTTNQKEYELRQGHFERAAFLRDQESGLRLKLKKLKERQKTKPTKPSTYNLTISGDHLRAIISRWTGIPVTRLSVLHRRSLLKLEDQIEERIIGQRSALDVLGNVIRRSKSGFKLPHRPHGVFLFVGPTGVGKTETARVLAELVFGSPDAMTKLDMSEFMERHQVARLLGAPPGYVGYNEPSRLVEQVRRRPHQLILFDEIEKAHPDVFHVLLQIMEDGQLTDGTGRVVHFHDTVIVLTSNIGGQLWQDASPVGFASTKRVARTEAAIDQLLKERFQPEFLGRLDAVVPFHPLSVDSLRTILGLEIDRLLKQGGSEGYHITVEERAITHLMNTLTAKRAGARDIRRLVQEQVGSKLADSVLRTPKSATLVVTTDKKGIKIHTQRVQLERTSTPYAKRTRATV
ncbi:MAG: ATP-dependent Clp protease ATP-binding subunit [Patescibacteria group bacterium]